jgi:hypothetical protein
MKLNTLTKVGSALIRLGGPLLRPREGHAASVATINFDGEATVNTGNLLTATSFTSISGVSPWFQSRDGNYSGTTGAPA